VVDLIFLKYLSIGLSKFAYPILSTGQENIDFNALIRYKKASAEGKKPVNGIQRRLIQGKPAKALLAIEGNM